MEMKIIGDHACEYERALEKEKGPFETSPCAGGSG